MDSLSSQEVVEALTVMLAERRRRARARQSAYQALARAIIFDDVDEHLERHAASTTHLAAAA